MATFCTENSLLFSRRPRAGAGGIPAPVTDRRLNEVVSSRLRGGRRQLRNPDVAETQVGRRVVPLDADRPLLQAAAVARVVAELAVVGPVRDLDAVYPRGEVSAVRDHRQGEPFAVL